MLTSAPPALSLTAFPTQAAAPVDAAERIGTLDVLRGIALLGMFLVHFIDEADKPTTAFGRALVTANSSFFQGRFFTMFAILFGAGFAVQLSRAESRGDQFVVRFVRRLLALAVFGIIAEDLFGFSVLLDYALWGFPLLLMRRWTTRTMIGAILVFLFAFPLYLGGRAAYDVATGGSEKVRQDGTLCTPYLNVVLPGAYSKRCVDLRQRARADSPPASRVRTPGYLGTVRFRFARTWAKYAHPRPLRYVPEFILCMFCIGVLLYRMGVFQHPGEHRRMIVTAMLLGAGASIATRSYLWDFMHSPAPMALSWPLQVISGAVLLPLLGGFWFALVYIGVVLLLVAHSPRWLLRLRTFGITGRMALTNYMLQVMVFEVLMSPYGLGLKLRPESALLAAVALFALDAAFSTWWLSRYRYGPLEWIWRSITYWKPQRLTH